MRDLPPADQCELEWTRMSTAAGPRRGSRDRPTLNQGEQPDHPPRQAPVRQQLFHKVPRREVRAPLLLLSSPDGRTGQAFNFDNPMLKAEPRAPCGKCSTQHDRNLNAVINISLFYGIPYCPQAGGRCSVTGRLWPFPDRDGETGPATRLAEDRRTAPPAPLRLATLIVCLLNVNTPQDVTRIFRTFTPFGVSWNVIRVPITRLTAKTVLIVVL